jgi:hypothetical protein
MSRLHYTLLELAVAVLCVLAVALYVLSQPGGVR